MKNSHYNELLGLGKHWLLIDPPILADCDGKTTDHFGSSASLGLLQVAKTIRYSGATAEIMDLRAVDITDALKTLLHSIEFPEIVGISNQYFSSFNSTLQIIGHIEKVAPKTRVVVGGAHGGSIAATRWPDSVTTIRGPFETAVGLEESFHGPHPLHLWPNFPNTVPVLEVTRGCIYNCDYCFRPAFRERRYQDVIGDLEYILENNSDKRLIYGTYNLGTAPELEERVLNRLSDEKLYAIAQTRPDTIVRLGKDFLALAKEGGIANLSFGMESINPRTLKKHNKTGNPEKWKKDTVTCLQWCQELGIRAKLNVMIFDGDTASDYEDLLDFLDTNRQFISGVTAGPLMAFPGTRIFGTAQRPAVLTPNVAHYFSDKDAFPVANGSISFENSLSLTKSLMEDYPYVTESLWRAASENQ